MKYVYRDRVKELLALIGAASLFSRGGGSFDESSTSYDDESFDTSVPSRSYDDGDNDGVEADVKSAEVNDEDGEMEEEKEEEGEEEGEVVVDGSSVLETKIDKKR